MQTLVSVFVYIYQAGKSLNLCCMAALTKMKFDWNLSILHLFFVVVTPLERHTFWGPHTFDAALNSPWSWQASSEIWHCWHLWNSSYWPMITNSSKSPLKLAILRTPSKGGIYIKWWKFVKCPKLTRNCQFWPKISNIVRNDAFSPKSGYLT